MVSQISLRIDIAEEGYGRDSEFPPQLEGGCIPMRHGYLDRAALRLCEDRLQSALAALRPSRPEPWKATDSLWRFSSAFPHSGWSR